MAMSQNFYGQNLQEMQCLDIRKIRNGMECCLRFQKKKIGLESKEKVEIIDLKILPEDSEKLVDNEKYFLGYHMNKKHWFTIILDGSVPIERIFEFIDASYYM